MKTGAEWEAAFDVYYNNITSNQAPGLNTHEKCLFLTKAEYEITLDYFSANSKGNTLGQGFDDSAKRQADFSSLMMTSLCDYRLQDPYYTCISEGMPKYVKAADIEFFQEGEPIPAPDLSETTPVDFDGYQASVTVGSGRSAQTYTMNGWPFTESGTIKYGAGSVDKIDDRSRLFVFPKDLFIVINEIYKLPDAKSSLQVIPLKYDEYMRLMSKPFKRPLKNQAWRLINKGNENSRVVEIIAGPGTDNIIGAYKVRYIRKPKPIITSSMDDLTINGYCWEGDNPEEEGIIPWGGICELDETLHEAILQRAVELAKIAWTATGQDNAQAVMAAGQRSE